MFWRKKIPALLLILALCLAGQACVFPQFWKGDDEAAGPKASRFEDILVPSELKMDENKSFFYQASDFKTGTLVYSGYVDVDSLVDFFSGSMVQNGWRLKSVFRSPKMVLLFEKERKTCLIMVYEKIFLTYVEIWVAPSAS